MTQKHSVLVIEDDDEVRHLLEGILSRCGFVVSGTRSAEEALRKMAGSNPSLVILDLQLPGMDGLECCKRIRSNPSTRLVPIILLSAYGSEVYRITALESGADDFISKPFSHGELVARIKAVLRRYESGESTRDQEIKDSIFSLNRDTGIVMIQDKKIQLTLKEFAMLEIFLRMKGKVVTRDILSTQVWEQETLSTSRTIDVHISRLRKKIGKYAKFIQTVGKLGYKYNSPSSENTEKP